MSSIFYCPCCGMEVHSTGTLPEAFQGHSQVCSPTVTTEKTEKNYKAGSAEWRKQRPLASGVLDYFPEALLEVAHTSWVGNEQHHPGEKLWWDKSKSSDEADALLRHLAQRGTTDTDGVRHSAKVAWRALALLQREIDSEK